MSYLFVNGHYAIRKNMIVSIFNITIQKCTKTEYKQGTHAHMYVLVREG